MDTSAHIRRKCAFDWSTSTNIIFANLEMDSMDDSITKESGGGAPSDDFFGWSGCGLAQNRAVSVGADGAFLVDGVGLRGIEEAHAASSSSPESVKFLHPYHAHPGQALFMENADIARVEVGCGTASARQGVPAKLFVRRHRPHRDPQGRALVEVPSVVMCIRCRDLARRHAFMSNGSQHRLQLLIVICAYYEWLAQPKSDSVTPARFPTAYNTCPRLPTAPILLSGFSRTLAATSAPCALSAPSTPSLQCPGSPCPTLMSVVHGAIPAPRSSPTVCPRRSRLSLLFLLVNHHAPPADSSEICHPHHFTRYRLPLLPAALHDAS
ncbi:hypothetical protein C8J57DRAFT_1601122 [Mycena rebaudengoi]|nr:hypothetical protein C8J57DRAFT_1601122 [Mycena rebaudengoi]